MVALKGPRLKLDRAKSQLEILYQELRIALDPETNPPKLDLDSHQQPKPPGVVDSRDWTGMTLYVVDVPKLGTDFGLLLGEILHHFRGALDHTAWELVRRGHAKRLSVKQAQLVSFPMARSEKSFDSNVGQKLPGVDPVLRAIIKRYQPYLRSVHPRAIRRLRNLTDTDKHRIILPSFIQAAKGNVEWDMEGAEEVGLIHHLKPNREIRRGTKVETLILIGGQPGQRKVTVQGGFGWQAIFPRSLIRTGKGRPAVPIREGLNEISTACTQILTEIAAHL